MESAILDHGRFRRWIIAGLVGAVTLFVDAGGPISATPPPKESIRAPAPGNLLLITVDTLRADALGFSGVQLGQTPVIDRLAAAGRVWTHAHAHSVTTLPSHASILTGLYPYEHGARENGGFKLSPDPATLATLLQSVGYRTAAFVAAFPLDSRFGLDRGFELYDDDFSSHQANRQLSQFSGYSERPASVVVQRAWSWWREHRGQRRFLWVHLYDPHVPYDPPEPFASRFAGRPYVAEVASVDSALAPILDHFLAGNEEPTLIVLTSDHGEALGAHGEQTHGLFAYEPTLRVPLIIWGNGVPPGVDSNPARLIDLLPTVADLLGLPVPEGLSGRSLLTPPHEDTESSSYFEALSSHLSFDWAPLRGVLSKRWKLIQLPIPELYDLTEDPGETRNLFATRRDIARRLAAQLPRSTNWPPTRQMSSEETSRLRSLGYLAGSDGSNRNYTAEDDPKNLVHLDRIMNYLPRLFALGQAEEGAKLARQVVDERPSMSLAHLYLVRFLLQQGKTAEALASLHQAESAGATDPELLIELALVLTNHGQSGKALEVLDRLDSRANEGDLIKARALALANLDRMGEAEALLEQRVAAEPKDARALESLSFLALQSERYAEAKDYAEAALAIDKDRPDAWNNLGVALYWLGNRDQALESWRRVLDLIPLNSDALLSYGLISAEAGRLQQAREALRRYLETASSPRHEAGRLQATKVLRKIGSG